MIETNDYVPVFFIVVSLSCKNTSTSKTQNEKHVRQACAHCMHIFISQKKTRKKRNKEDKPKELTRNRKKCDVAEIFFDLETIK